MKPKTIIACFVFMLALCAFNQLKAQWAANGNHIYNTNSGFVGIGTSSPTTLLHVAKQMTEPNITVQNLGGSGGATFTMIDNASGANWKFKATLSGGFKIRDHANGLDVIVVEPNSFANAIYIRSNDNIGIGTATPDLSALLDLSSTTKGLLPPRLTQVQIAGIADPANGLLAYCTTDNKLYAYLSGSGVWKELQFGSNTLTPNEPCGSPMTKTHSAGTVAPVDKTVTYGTVMTDITGTDKCWITQNLGADQEAASASDPNESSAGWYWQFNLQQGYKHDGVVRTPNTAWITSITQNSDWLPENDPCNLLLGTGWRIPTMLEWYTADQNQGWDNISETFASVLKLHQNGYLDKTTGAITSRGTTARRWTSTQYNTTQGWCFRDADRYNFEKAYGFALRCLRD